MADDFYICPGCGEEVKVGAKRCLHCDPPKPWEQEAHLDGIDLDPAGDDDFDYQRFVENEFGGGAKPHGTGKLWVITGIVLLIALAMMGFFF